MKQGLYWVLFAVTFLAGSSLAISAQEQGSSAQEVKIAFVDTVAVLQGTAQGQREISQLENYIAEERKRLESETMEVQQLRQQLISQGGSLNNEARGEMQRQIEDRERKLQRDQEDIEREINRRRNEMFNRMSDKIQRVIVDYAEENNLLVVFIQDPALPYVSPSLDITEAIIQAYDAANPVQAPAASSTPPQ